MTEPSLFRIPAFRILWATGAFSGTLRWLEVLSIGLFVYDETRSPLAVALMMVVRMLPMILFGTLIGAYAERFDRKRLLLTGMISVGSVATVLAVLAAHDALALWMIAMAVFVSGMLFTVDVTVRRTLLGEAAGAQAIGRAMALDSATGNATRMLGPLTGGIVYEALGLEGTYTIAAVMYAVVIILVAFLPSPRRHAHDFEHETFFASIVAAFRYVRSQPPILATLSITVIINVWAFPVATMVPVVGRDTLALSPAWVGVLASAEGLGALVGALMLSSLIRPAFYVRVYVLGSFVFVAAIMVFSAMPVFAGAWPALLVGGLGIAGFAAMQPTLILSATDPAYRSRVMGLLTVCIGTGPIGIFHLGLMAQWFGTSNAIYVMAVEGIFMMTLAVMCWAPLRRRGL